jgi:DNA-binding NarL/FixJ family response regulator
VRAPLTDVELDVLEDAAHGMTVGETAASRHKSVQTVKSQRKSILAKLDARNMTHAVSMALHGHLIAGHVEDEPVDE